MENVQRGEKGDRWGRGWGRPHVQASFIVIFLGQALFISVFQHSLKTLSVTPGNVPICIRNYMTILVIALLKKLNLI